MKRLFVIMALALCLPFAGCEKESAPVKLGETEIVAYTSVVAYTAIIDGSGEYSASIDNPAVADVSVTGSLVALLWESPFLLVIEPKQEGKAVITVTDTESGQTARCSLTVELFLTSILINDIRVNVDADRPEAIEADLAADESIPPVGGTIRRNNTTWAFADATEEEFARGTITEKEITEWNPAFDFLPIEGGIRYYKKWIFSSGDEDPREWDVYIADDISTRMAMPVRPYFRTMLFYEDLTEHYRAEYPEAGVRSVARVLTTDKF